METLVLIIHVVLSVFLVILILLQQGKGADAGASFGSGASQTVFGGRGSSGFLARLTATCAFVLLLTSLGLGIINKQKVEQMKNVNLGVPESPAGNVEPSSPVAPSTNKHSDVPAAGNSRTTSGPDVPSGK